MPLIDFHMHSTTSDGVWTPPELFDFIRRKGIEVMSLTDHDTMKAYPLPADIAAKAISGMEVDTKCNGVTAHLLVYGINSPDAPLLQLLTTQREARRARMQEMLERLRERGVDVALDEVEAQAAGASSLGRPHLARVLVSRGLVGSVQEAFDRYLADDQDAYVALDRLESRTCVDLAHASGAIVSVAHPMRLREPASLDAMRAAGVDGIEIVHPSANADARRDLRDYAERYGLLQTAGSDFHAPADGHEPGVEFEAEHVERLLEAVGHSAASFSGTESASKSASAHTGAKA